MMTLTTVVILLVGALVVAGAILVRSACAGKSCGSSRVCGNLGCRHVNAADAKFCANCGAPLRRA